MGAARIPHGEADGLATPVPRLHGHVSTRWKGAIMQVYLVRHAIAAPREAGFVDDAARELTPIGMKKMRRNAEALRRLGVALDEVWTSPLVRARQTAEILAQGLGGKSPVKVVAALEPGGTFEDLRARLAGHARLSAVALVGHEPGMSELAGFLTGAGRSLMFRFKKGAVALMEIDDFSSPVRGELCWFLTPKMMGLMAGR